MAAICLRKIIFSSQKHRTLLCGYFICIRAERACLVKKILYLHLGTDNENSSVKSAAKVFCLCDEYKYKSFWRKDQKKIKKKLEKIKFL